MTRCLVFLFLMLGFPHAQDNPTIPIAVVVDDSSGAPVKDELVIVQDLNDHEHEVGRALTGANGEIPILKLPTGLYRAIATAPYGLWKTKVREFLVNDTPIRLILAVEPMPTHGYGDTVTAGDQQMFVRVLDPDGHPVAGASVLARDDDATLHLERWYKTDQAGGATVEVVSDPLILVVIFGKALVTREISSKTLQQIIQLPRP